MKFLSENERERDKNVNNFTLETKERKKERWRKKLVSTFNFCFVIFWLRDNNINILLFSRLSNKKLKDE